MKYLFIDASQNDTYMQIGDESGFCVETFDTDRSLGAKISELFDKILQKRQWDISQIDLLAACTGPGSLTGLRVALAFLRTISMVSEKPLCGIDLFSWACRTLADKGVSGKVSLVQPTLIDKAFRVDCSLPECTDPGLPVLCGRTEAKGENVYGVRYEAEGVMPVEPSPETLHKMLLEHPVCKADFDEMLRVLPLYVIPSQAERKLEIQA